MGNLKSLIYKLWNLDWQALRGVQKSKFINSMYIWVFIVPVVAKLLYKVNKQLEFKFFGQSIVIEFSLPFSWKTFFFCALCFGLANVILVLFCPKIINDHLSYAGFRGDGKGEEHLSKYSSDIGMTYDYYVKLTEGIKGLVEKEFEEDYPTREEHLQLYFWSIYNASNLYHQNWRRICILFYALGMILFGWVLVLNIIWVFSVVL